MVSLLEFFTSHQLIVLFPWETKFWELFPSQGERGHLLHVGSQAPGSSSLGFLLFSAGLHCSLHRLTSTTSPITWMYGYLEYWSFLESINFDLLSKSYLNVHCITTSKFGRIWEEQTQWFFRKFYYTQNFLSVYREPIMVIRLYMILYFSRNARGKKN